AAGSVRSAARPRSRARSRPRAARARRGSGSPRSGRARSRTTAPRRAPRTSGAWRPRRRGPRSRSGAARRRCGSPGSLLARAMEPDARAEVNVSDAVTLHALTCGWLEASLGLFRAGEPGRSRVPVPSFLIRHPRGTVVCDTGLPRALQHGAEARGGPIARVFEIAFAPGEELEARLAALGVDPARVDWLVTSHLHFDHVGGNAALPNARWLLQRREWEAAHDDEWRARHFV